MRQWQRDGVIMAAMAALVTLGCSSEPAGSGATTTDVGGGADVSGALDAGGGGDGGSGNDGGSGADTAADSAAPADTATGPVATCTSGGFWNGGNKESPLMHPGGDCIGCHTQLGEGPSFAIAGTVYPTLYEKLDCNGVNGPLGSVKVVIQGADDKIFELPVNSAGNFYLETINATALKLPYRARVESPKGSVAMGTAQTLGGCNTCHADPPTGGAPGRVVAP